MEAYGQDRGLVLLQRWAAEDWRPPPPFTLVELLRLNGFVAEWRLVAVEEGQQGLVRWLTEIQQVLTRALPYAAD